jgi:nucleotide-binding universal stress UspA family protein
MYQRILVPLDGSELAECVLPHVEAISGGCQVPEVIFVRAVSAPQHISGAFYNVAESELKQFHIKAKTSAEEYLKKLVERTKYDGANIKWTVIDGEAAEALADYAKKVDADLIIIATHGRSGVSRWVMGSVADRLLRSSCAPVLMVRAPGCIPGI